MVEVGDWRISPDFPANDAGNCKEAAEPARDSAATASIPSSESTSGAPSDAAATNGTEKSLSAEAPEFEPILCTASAAGALATASTGASMGARTSAWVERTNILDMLPPSHVECLRGSYPDAYGHHYRYYVGCLKTFSKRNGYGFIECKQAFEEFGRDVFIHHNYVKQPLFFDQPMEFAVTQNERLEPQACDVQWLPRLPWLHTERATNSVAPPAKGSIVCNGRGRGSGTSAYPSVAEALATLTRQPATDGPGLDCPSAASVLKAVTSRSGQFDGPGTGAAVAIRPPAEEVRHLGVLKSYSEAQGYGFILCPEVTQRAKRDVYFDRFQMPANQRWMFGQTLEFTVLMNSSGHPQARSINWEPVPQIPRPNGSVQPPPGRLHQVNQDDGATLQDPRRLCHGARTLKLLRGLMGTIRSGDAGKAVLLAVEHQHSAQDSGRSTSTDATYDDPDVDLVLFVLDRMLDRSACAYDRAVRTMKEMEKLVLLTMLLKMLKVAGPRCSDLLTWVHNLIDALDVESTEVRDQIGGVAGTAAKSAKDALGHNPQLKEGKLKDSLERSMKRLSEIARHSVPDSGQHSR